MMHKIAKILFLGFIFSRFSFAEISQETWWLAHSRNNSQAQYSLAEAYNPDIFNDRRYESYASYDCDVDEFYLDSEDRKVARCIEKNTEKYIHWLLKSANNHYPLAQAQLGIEYIKGEKVDQNIKQGLYWLEKAVGPISEKANYSVGEGTMWLKNKANFKGVGSAHYALAVLYEEGELVKLDYTKAIKHYELAANSFDFGYTNKAQRKLYALYKNKLDDKEKAVYWLDKIKIEYYKKTQKPQ